MENSSRNILVIIQARLGSSRLPGKVLKVCAGKEILNWIIERLKPSKFHPIFMVATTINSIDDPIEDWCNQNTIHCFRGDEDDVLMRFYQASQSMGHNGVIVRICADNPLSSYKVMDMVIEEFYQTGVDYLSNSNKEPNFLEDGFDVEVFSSEALELANKKATLKSDREHVCPWIKNNLKANWLRTCPDYSGKLSVDTLQDFFAVEAVIKELRTSSHFSIWEVNELLKRKPEILEINRESVINSGYHKSLREDGLIN